MSLRKIKSIIFPRLKKLYIRYKYRRHAKKVAEITKNVVLLRDRVYFELYNNLKFFVSRKFRPPSYSFLKNKYLKNLPLQILSDIFIKEIYEREYKPKEGDVVIDAGATIGIFTCKAAKIVGNKGKVLAIEPEKERSNYLRRNVELNQLENVIIIEKGLWSNKNKKRIYLGKGSPSFFRRTENYEEIEVDTIDSILTELGIKRVDFIKMDIEDAEVEALKGAKTTLKNNRVNLAIAAYHTLRGIPTYKIIIPFLRQLSFEIKKSDGYVYGEKRSEIKT